MKTDIHPKYTDTTFSCACGAEFIAGSTLKEDKFKTEICSKCHPFYTGKQKLIDSSGQVEKFRAKMEKAKAAQAKAASDVKIVEEEEKVKEKTKVIEEKEATTEEVKEEKAEVVEEEAK